MPEAQVVDSKPKMSNDMIMSMFNPSPMQMSPHMNPHAAAAHHMGAMSNGMGMGMGMGMSMGFGGAGYPQPASAGMSMPPMGGMAAGASASTSPMGMPTGMGMGGSMGGMGMPMGMNMAGAGMAAQGPMQMGAYPSAGQMGGHGGMGMNGMGMTMGMGGAGSGTTMHSPASAAMTPHTQQSPMSMMGMPQGYAAAPPQAAMPGAAPMQMMNGHSTYSAQYSAGWTHSGMPAPGQPQRMA